MVLKVRNAILQLESKTTLLNVILIGQGNGFVLVSLMGNIWLAYVGGYGQTTLEFGLRKLPGTLIDKDRNDMPKLDDSYNVYEDNQWWYAWKELTIKEQTIGNATKVIITELSTLVGFLQE